MMNNVTSMVDAPCGMFEWMPLLVKRIQAKVPGFTYLGLDIVDSVVSNNKKYQSKFIHFEAGNILDDALPQQQDFILSRDVLMHFSYADVLRVLENLARAKARFLGLGSFPNGSNKQIQTGDWFPINLMAEPFSLWPDHILCEFDPHGKHILIYTAKSIGMWKLESLRKRIEQATG
jgi:hypothetical protein